MPAIEESRTARELVLDRRFGPYFFGNLFSNAGNWFQNIAAGILVFEITGSNTLASLLWGLAAGVLSTLLARAMFRIQRRDVDSSLDESELLAQPATVIVPLSATDMGKVRMRMGQLTVERYALGEDPDDTFASNDSVENVRITPEHVYVRRIHTDR